jgi:hypothetical protein
LGDRRHVNDRLEVNNNDGVLEVDDGGRLEVDNSVLWARVEDYGELWCWGRGQ